MVGAVRAAVARFCHGASPQHDRTVLALRYPG
jgi:hypothetical protein